MSKSFFSHITLFNDQSVTLPRILLFGSYFQFNPAPPVEFLERFLFFLLDQHIPHICDKLC